jgi:hypothetical protein
LRRQFSRPTAGFARLASVEKLVMVHGDNLVDLREEIIREISHMGGCLATMAGVSLCPAPDFDRWVDRVTVQPMSRLPVLRPAPKSGAETQKTPGRNRELGRLGDRRA